MAASWHMSGPDAPHILILGGTGEAAALADAVVARGRDRVKVTTSLAGRTATPATVPGECRIGGFGGPDGMARYLRDGGVSVVVDATHPFATQISRHAVMACSAADVPRLRLERPAWTPQDGDCWHMMPSIAAAAQALPDYGRRAFLTVGRTELEPFAACRDVWFLVRLVDQPDTPLPLANSVLEIGRGPFDIAAEQELMTRHEIDTLVCKASGGDMTRAKLDAARTLKCPVLMIARPPAPDGPRVHNVAGAMEWIVDRIGALRT